MNFDLTEEHVLLQQSARAFAREFLSPFAAKIDEQENIPTAVHVELARRGWYGVTTPTSLGGQGKDMIALTLVIEEIAAVCASTSALISVSNSLIAAPLTHYGTDEQKNTFLKPIAQGEQRGCFALTESHAGSDASAIKLRAERHSDGYILSGTKSLITNGAEADLCIIFAVTNPAAGAKGITAFVVPLNSSGIRRSEKRKKLGLAGTSTCDLFFDRCFVSEACRLGEEGQGIKIALQTLDASRIGVAAQAVGIAFGALRTALQYSKHRSTFGKALSHHQAIQFKLADMATELEGARLLTWRAATLKDTAKKHAQAAAMAKLFASEVANRVCKEAIQIVGGLGYMKELPLERFYRDAKITELYEGTSEIQRMIIAQGELQ